MLIAQAREPAEGVEVTGMTRLSAYIIAFNEEERIETAIRSVLWADEVVVVDSCSTDRTREIARGLGARVVEVPFEGFGRQRNRAVAETAGEWVFNIDADEVCTPEVRDEILALLDSPDPLDAYFVARRNIFMGRWLRHGGWYPDTRQPQLFRRGAVTYREDLVHEGWDVRGRAGRLRNANIHHPFRDLAHLLDKMNRYSTLGARQLAERGVRRGPAAAVFRAAWAFFRTWVLKAGLLDGWPGFVMAVTTAEATFHKHAKVIERERDRG